MKITRIGYFHLGRMIGGWEFEGKLVGRDNVTRFENIAPPWLQLPKDGRVLVNDVEIVAWSKARKDSMKEDSEGWVKA